jgi:hypothetical protein
VREKSLVGGRNRNGIAVYEENNDKFASINDNYFNKVNASRVLDFLPNKHDIQLMDNNYV